MTLLSCTKAITCGVCKIIIETDRQIFGDIEFIVQDILFNTANTGVPKNTEVSWSGAL